MESRSPLDAYYTPEWAADALANALPSSLDGSVLDPAVGGGSLLAAVENRFGARARLLGLDVNDTAAVHLKALHPEWNVSTADLLRPASRAASRAWRAALREDLAAVVMNPPFSYRGNGGATISYSKFKGRVAPSMHFLTEVVSSLNPREGFFAILPDGALDAERHQALWEQLRTDFFVERLSRLRSSSFRGARVSTSIVRLVRSAHGGPMSAPMRNSPVRVAAAEAAPGECACVEVVRGRVPTHALRSFSPGELSAPFIHTTDMLTTRLPRSAPDRLADHAPLLLVSRVGKWRRPRLIDVGRVVLSDCLFGIRPRTQARLAALIDALPEFEKDLGSRLRGTGAPYLTLNDVVDALTTTGWHAHVVKAGSTRTTCCCGCGEAATACTEAIDGLSAG